MEGKSPASDLTLEISWLVPSTHHLPPQQKENTETPWLTFMSAGIMCNDTSQWFSFPLLAPIRGPCCSHKPLPFGVLIGRIEVNRQAIEKVGSPRIHTCTHACRFLIPLRTLAGRDERSSRSCNTPRLFEVRLNGIHTEIIIRQPQTRPIKPFCVYIIKELAIAFSPSCNRASR